MKLLTILLLAATPVKAEVPANRPACRDQTSDAYFFPKGWISDSKERSDGDQFARRWYSKALTAMSEPSLSCRAPANDVYRFLWLRTWGRPIAVRVEGLTSGAAIFAVELDGACGYGLGKVSRHKQRKLTDGEWTRIVNDLQALQFWTLPTRVPDDGLDGAQWVMEGRKGSQYHVVERWSPKGGAYREFCLSLLKLLDMVPDGNGKRDAIY